MYVHLTNQLSQRYNNDDHNVTAFRFLDGHTMTLLVGCGADG